MNSHLRFAPLVVSLLVGAGCTTSADPARAATPERERDQPQKCLGAGMDRRVCIQIASQRCYAGFDIFEQDVTEEEGVVRNGLYFKCKP